MKALSKLNISAEAIAQINTSRDKLRAHAGIQVDILEANETTIKIRVEQVDLKNNYLLNQSQLVSRAGAVFSPLERKFKLHFVPTAYSPDLDMVTGSWIEQKMDELGLKRNDVIAQMGIDKVTLSRCVNGLLNMSRFNKAAFYYYFMSYEINRDMRDYLNKKEQKAENEPVYTFAVKGELDARASVKFEDTLRNLAKIHDRLVLDFSECTYISSAGLGVILSNYEKFKDFTIKKCPPRIRQVFNVLALDLLIKVED